MSWRDRLAVLAFAIRSRFTATGRVDAFGTLPRPSRPADHATPADFPVSEVRTMAKRHPEIDTRNPFIPSHSPVCRLADTALLFSVALSGFLAALACLIWGA